MRCGFNEAAAALPRKICRGRIRRSRSCGFNEAAAALPRKIQKALSGSPQPRMRCFNEAAAALPRKIASCVAAGGC